MIIIFLIRRNCVVSVSRKLYLGHRIVIYILHFVLRDRLNKLKRSRLPSGRKNGGMKTDGHLLNRLANPFKTLFV